MMHTLERSQTVCTTIEKAWNFLQAPANLNTITPEDLSFQILSDIPHVMFNGLIIKYRITIPLIGTRQWVAEIKHIDEFSSFVDEQRVGPYTFWYHYHELRQVEGGVTILDRVYYTIPYGIFGELLHRLFIRRTLDRIFDYRTKKIKEILEP